MATGTEDIGHKAVEIATQGENSDTGSLKLHLDWNEFLHYIGIWLVTWVILFMALIIITIANGGKNVIRDTIETTDMLNMSFSLILSAMLEQIWSKESIKMPFYKIMLGCEICLTIFGGMLYVAYSIVEETNLLLQKSFAINLGYAVASSIVVALGFLSRSLVRN